MAVMTPAVPSSRPSSLVAAAESPLILSLVIVPGPVAVTLEWPVPRTGLRRGSPKESQE